MLFGLALALFVFYVLYHFALWANELWHRSQVSHDIFCPPKLPIIGHLFSLPKSRYDWCTFLIEQSNDARRQGHSLVKWWVLHKICVWTIDAETSKAILENSVELRKGRDYAFFGQWLGQGLLLSDGAKWRRQRRMLTPIFHFTMLEQYTAIFNRHARTLCSKLLHLSNGPAQDISPLITRCSLDIVAEAIMGVVLDSEKAECRDYVAAVKEFNDLAHRYTTNPLHTIFPLTWHWSSKGEQTRQCLHTLKQFTRRVIDERISKRKPSQTSNTIEQQATVPSSSSSRKRMAMAFLDLLLEMEDARGLDREELREQVDTFMFEGHDTSAHSLIWTLWCLATHPLCQHAARVEIGQQMLANADGKEDYNVEHCEEHREWGASDVNELRYLDRCIREALRLFPPVPVLERDLQHDVPIVEGGGSGGHRRVLPRGTMVMVSPMILHHNERVYHRHWQYDPDRFLPDAMAERSTFDYIPFSAGPRNCIGQKFALLEVKIVLAHLLAKCRFSTDLPFAANRPAMEAILRPELGLPIRIEMI